MLPQIRAWKGGINYVFLLRPTSYLGACILIVLIFCLILYHWAAYPHLPDFRWTYLRSRYLAVMFQLRVYPFLYYTSHASTALVCWPPLHSYVYASLSSYPFYLISFALDTSPYCAPFDAFLKSWRVSLLYYDSISLYLYIRTLVATTVSSDLVSFVKSGH